MSGECQRVAPGVFLVGGAGLSDGADCQVYALDLGDLVLIDRGAGGGELAVDRGEYPLGRSGPVLHTLVLTHAHVDHIGPVARIKQETDCCVVAHARDAPAIESGDSL